MVGTLNELNLSPWRNRLARLTVNQKVGGSSPPGDVKYFLSGMICLCNTSNILLSSFFRPARMCPGPATEIGPSC